MKHTAEMFVMVYLKPKPAMKSIK